MYYGLCASEDADNRAIVVETPKMMFNFRIDLKVIMLTDGSDNYNSL